MRKLGIKRLVIKLTLICLSLALVSWFFIWSLRGTHYPGMNAHGELIVNGTIIPDKRIRIFQQGDEFLAVLPLSSVLQELGYHVEWMDTETAQVEISGEVFVFSLEKVYRRGEEDNLYEPGLGRESVFVESAKNEIYIDSAALLATLKNLGVQIEIIINPQDRVILIRNS